MKMQNLPRGAIYLVTAMLLMLPAAAQNNTSDTHAHDWYKEQVVPKLKQQQAETQAGTTTSTTTTAAKSPADQIIDQSLGSVNTSYQGAHKWFPDDQIGLAVVAVVGVLVIAVVAFTARKKKKND